LFIKGTPPRNVNKIQQIWRPGTTRGYKQIVDDTYFEPRKVALNNNSSMFKIRSAITGHGQEGEFIGRNHFINLNGGDKEFEWLVWKECADNPIYPQGGTWIYDRAGWCPGAPTTLKEMEITNMVNPGDSVIIDYGVETASGDSRYIVNCQLVSYSSPNFTHDIAIDEIQRPSTRIEFGRFNPICFDPVVVIQNKGSDVVTKALITYKVKGGEALTYDWSGHLSFLEKDTITLPIEKTSFWLGDGSNIFVAEANFLDNTPDQYPRNNTMESAFILPDVLQPDFIVVLKTNSFPNENKLYIRDITGNTIYKRTIIGPNTKYEKELSLEQGCYELEITDTGNDGLSFWANPNQGNGDLYFRKKNFIRIKNFNPDFGKFLRYSFLVGNIDKVDDQIISGDVFDIFPNPASGYAKLKFNIVSMHNSRLEITDITGRKIMQLDENTLSSGEIDLDFSGYTPGIYLVKFIQDGKSYVKKLVVE
ncbi:MAG TPA: T9SS type A sorting domain-containing protein, partial [Bacteroidetes bacterium]|nr:T9SS type A sorting domain-containing protein [Bacteroidota bacterium]